MTSNRWTLLVIIESYRRKRKWSTNNSPKQQWPLTQFKNSKCWFRIKFRKLIETQDLLFCEETHLLHKALFIQCLCKRHQQFVCNNRGEKVKVVKSSSFITVLWATARLNTDWIPDGDFMERRSILSLHSSFAVKLLVSEGTFHFKGDFEDGFYDVLTLRLKIRPHWGFSSSVNLSIIFSLNLFIVFSVEKVKNLDQTPKWGQMLTNQMYQWYWVF